MTDIFVFGSNLAGRHGAGAALYAAKHYGAEYGCGIGRTGNAFAIPTKDYKLRSLPLPIIQRYVWYFLGYVRGCNDLNAGFTFKVTAIGCGLAGYKIAQIAPMFDKIPPNCVMPESFRPYIEHSGEFWKS